MITEVKRSPTRSVRSGNGRQPKAPAVVHLSVAERAEKGKAARVAAPRDAQGEWAPAADRRDPVEVLEEQAASRVPELVPIRYGRMLVSPFTFFRGAAYPMAADLAGAPRSGLDVQLCGDAHLSNFGAFGAPDRRLVFSINDFDETLPGPFEWDVKRLVASFAVAGRDRGFDAKQRRSINRGVSQAYREAIREFAGMPNLDLWYSRIDVDEHRRAGGRAGLREGAQAVRGQHGQGALQGQPAGAGEAHDHRRRRAADRERPAADRADRRDRVRRRGSRPRGVHARRHPLLPPHAEPRPPAAARALPLRARGPQGRRRRAASARARGSCSCSAATSSDPLFLQVKEAQASVLEPYLGKSKFNHHGQRVVEGQRLTQAAGDIMLGWIRVADQQGTDRDFYIRQLWDGKGSALVDLMQPKAMTLYGRLCGHALAKAHARSGDAIAIASYLGSGGTFDRAMSAFAEAYADQNERDYASLQEAVASGRVVSETGL